MDVIEAIRTRRSIGKLEGEVRRETIIELIELATLAPNHRLTEPWTFTVISGAARAQLGRIWAESAGVSVESAMRQEFIEREARKPLRAPTLIVVSTRTDPILLNAEEDFSAAAAAVENLLLAAHALGFAAIWRTGKMVHDLAVKGFLGLDPNDRIVAIVYIGKTPLVEGKMRPRGAEAVTRWIGDSV